MSAHPPNRPNGRCCSEGGAVSFLGSDSACRANALAQRTSFTMNASTIQIGPMVGAIRKGSGYLLCLFMIIIHIHTNSTPIHIEFTQNPHKISTKLSPDSHTKSTQQVIHYKCHYPLKWPNGRCYLDDSRFSSLPVLGSVFCVVCGATHISWKIRNLSRYARRTSQRC